MSAKPRTFGWIAFPMASLLFAALLATARADAPGKTPPPGSAPSEVAPHQPPGGPGASLPPDVTWDALREHFKAAIFVVREGPHRWGIRAENGDASGSDVDRALRGLAVEALTAAHDDIAWVVGEILDNRLFVSQPMMPGDALKPREEYLNALIDNGTFAAPLRRFTDALIRSKGSTCSDCLKSLPASRDVSWSQVKEYIGDFIHVEEVDGEGRVRLHIATAENRIPEFHSSHHDLAAAVYAAMNRAKASPALVQSVQSDLNEELKQVAEGQPEAIRNELNQKLPARILQDPRCLTPILAELDETLERHSLHCSDCPRTR